MKKTRPGPGPQVGFQRRPPRGLPVQKSVRIDPELIERTEERAMRETLALGVSVDFSVLIRRGLELVLAQPLPELASAVPCNPTPVGCGKATVCLTCRASGPGRSIVCPRTGLEATR